MYQKTNEIKNYDVKQVSCSDRKEFDFARTPALKNTSENIDLVLLIRLMLEYTTKNTYNVNARDRLWFTRVKNELLSLVENIR
ncbi:MAG: hypothetical protein ACREBI_09105 [Nitrosotalea sp.]